MMNDKRPDETRRLLKVFGIAVTDFEAQSEELLNRIRGSKTAGPDVVAALRDLLQLVNRATERWQDVTDQLFVFQRRRLSEIAEALSELTA
jgi:uncharacterized NAD(P)/FAD-binding protein YdhS